MDESLYHLHAQKVIVFHPGSLYLRIGRASDINPVKILHAVGRLRRIPTNVNNKSSRHEHRDMILPTMQYNSLPEFNEFRQQVSQSIQSNQFPAAGKYARRSVPAQDILNFNKVSEPEELTLDENELDPFLINENCQTETLFDQDILNLSENDVQKFNISFPIRRGELNLHCGIGGSLAAIMADLEKIWLYALNKCLGINTKDIYEHSAVLVVSDINNRSHLRELTNLILQNLGFQSCFLVQDHVAALFGAGLGYACVVDIGDQKTSISCVEDGISHTITQLRLSYGGGDITQIFNALLKNCMFPLYKCDVNKNYGDASLLMRLKEEFCHLNLTSCAVQEKSFEVIRDKKRLRYTIQLADECVVAPIALFHTELMNITGRNKEVNLQSKGNYPQDAEDCFSGDYIRETGRRNGREHSLEGAAPITVEVEDEIVADTFDVEKDVISKIKDKDELIYKSNGQILPLDQAIMRSIERCPSEELKRKMYSCILLVGGGAKIIGLNYIIEKKIESQLITNRLTDMPIFEVNTYKKDMDQAMTSWKGAAIMSCLESATELWITRMEWEKYGLRALREKATFFL